ncbi:hypothetical protein D7B24_009558 [Verticillium nonalfalfae]|uniref:Uncharacterized protein n=1 Tax=Verticillium nonalfalfae TaxID=1051616 RepID=A0A3M9Y4F7_9PEZI|nr:uncharacterized protein D7B24_009558 [Verticillium nonalfalfae]RNJ54666.1 hypothetical protein D7B24_009558 [Verticillium nonalfalfae]
MSPLSSSSSIGILASGVSLGSWPARTARGGLPRTRDGILGFGLLVKDVNAVRYGAMDSRQAVGAASELL